MAGWKTKRCSCPDIKHKDYELKEFKWPKKYFYSIKLPFFSKDREKILERIKAGFREIEAKGYKYNKNRHMVLHEHDRLLRRGDILIEIEYPGNRDVRVKVFDKKHIFSKPHIGKIENLHESLRKLGIHLNKKNKKVKDIYYWYIGCPHCVKDLNKYRTIIFVEVT